MAFPKKKTRSISIDGTKYHWLVGPNDGYNVFVAQKEGVDGRRIEVVFATDINRIWVEFPQIDELNLKIIKPKEAAAIIRQALQLGWNPEQKGSPTKFDVVDDKLIERKKS